MLHGVKLATPSADEFLKFFPAYGSSVVVWVFDYDDQEEECKHHLLFKSSNLRGIWVVEPGSEASRFISFRVVRAIVCPSKDKKQFTEIKDFLYKHPQAEELMFPDDDGGSDDGDGEDG